MEITAIVVARRGSERVPNKNQTLLAGCPLFLRKLRQLRRVSNINRVVFGSDSEEMLDKAKREGFETIRRPDFFCNEKIASANDMIGNMVDSIKTDIVVWAHCTNPLISSDTYSNAIDAFLSNRDRFDSLLSVVKLQEHLWHKTEDGFKALNYNPYSKRHTPAKELPPYYMQDGGIFIQPWEQMKQNRYFFGKNPYLFLIPEEEFLDINTHRDVLLAKAIVEERNNG